MSLVYVCSVRGSAGKNLVCLGLGRKMLDEGFNLAVTKPYGAKPLRIDDTYTDADAWMINQTLELGLDPAQCCPAVRTQDLVARTLRGEDLGVPQRIKDTCRELEKGRDLVIMCGAGTLRSGAMVGLSGYKTALELGAKVVIVERYENDFFLDDLLSAAARLGDNLAGVIVNAVDQEMNDALEEQVIPYLKGRGIETLGVMPKDDLLSSVTIADLAESLGAQTLTSRQHHDRLIRRFFIGAMQVGHASRFFGGARDFACIVGGDRPDMQVAAIQGGAACLILTGNFYPGELILSQAEEREVTVLLVRSDTFSTARNLDLARQRASLAQPEKLARGMELVREGVYWDALYRSLGIEPKQG